MSETNPGINQENIVAPVSAEAEKAKELLNKERVGLQAVLLMDAKTASSEETVKALTEIRSKSDAPNLETITKSSKFERDNYWKVKQNKDKEPMSFDEQKSEWISSADQILGAFRSNSEQETLLKKLGYDKNKGAKEFYEEFFVEGKGNLGFFGKKIAESFTEEDLKSAQKKSITIVEAGSDGAKITREISLLDALGGFYGQKSSEVARLVAEGMSNLKNNEEEFKKTAGEQVTNLSDNDRGLLANITAQSAGWVKNENARLEKVQREQEEKRRKEEEEAKKNSPEGLAKQVTEIYDRISKSDKDLVKHFLPVLEQYKTAPKDVSDDLYRDTAKAVMEAFTKAESLSSKPEDEQILNIISLFDSFDVIDSSKFTDKEKEFYIKSARSISEKLSQKNIKMIDPRTQIDYLAKIGETEEQEVEDDQVGKNFVKLNGFMKGDTVFRKPVILRGVKKKGSEKPAEPDGSEPTPSEITNKIKALESEISGTNSEFIKRFLPILKAYEDRPQDIGEDVYNEKSNEALDVFKKLKDNADKPEDQQALILLDLFDSLVITPEMMRLNDQEKEYCKGLIESVINKLNEAGITLVPFKAGEEMQESTMDVLLEREVDDEALVGKAVDVEAYGFKKGEEILRKQKVVIGKKKASKEPGQGEAAGATMDGAAKEGQGDNPPATEEQKPAEPAQDAQNQPQAGGVGEQAQPAQAEAISGDASPQAVAGGSDEQAAIPTTGHATPEDPDRIAKGQQEIPTQDQINAELARAVLLADGRDLNEEEKVRIKEGEKADEVIKKTNLNSVTPNNDN